MLFALNMQIPLQKGAAVAEWLSSWLAEQEDRGSIPSLATWFFRDWLSPASKSRYGWKIAKSTLILNNNNNNNNNLYRKKCFICQNIKTRANSILVYDEILVFPLTASIIWNSKWNAYSQGQTCTRHRKHLICLNWRNQTKSC